MCERSLHPEGRGKKERSQVDVFIGCSCDGKCCISSIPFKLRRQTPVPDRFLLKLLPFEFSKRMHVGRGWGRAYGALTWKILRVQSLLIGDLYMTVIDGSLGDHSLIRQWKAVEVCVLRTQTEEADSLVISASAALSRPYNSY